VASRSDSGMAQNGGRRHPQTRSASAAWRTELEIQVMGLESGFDPKEIFALACHSPQPRRQRTFQSEMNAHS